MIEKLKNFGKLLGINEIVECRNFENGSAMNCYLFPQKIITVFADLPNREKVIVLAHELGHFLNRNKYEFIVDLSAECLELTNRFPHTQITVNYYHSGLDKQIKANALESIIEEETLAWQSAEEILTHLGIKRGPDFIKYKKKSLQTYIDGLAYSKKFKKKLNLKLQFDHGHESDV